jgi:hypothetical protein
MERERDQLHGLHAMRRHRLHVMRLHILYQFIRKKLPDSHQTNMHIEFTDFPPGTNNHYLLHWSKPRLHHHLHVSKHRLHYHLHGSKPRLHGVRVISLGKKARLNGVCVFSLGK